MTQIVLLDGSTALVDAADFPLIEQYNWSHSKVCNRDGYATAWVNGKNTLMHRLLIGADRDQWVDHINGIGLDNRRENLRLCSRTENMWNSRKRAHSAQPFKGIQRHRAKWRANICVRGRRILVGSFETPEAAAAAYDKAAKEYFGDFARVNFPNVA